MRHQEITVYKAGNLQFNQESGEVEPVNQPPEKMKAIVISNCLECPKWQKCKPSKRLTFKTMPSTVDILPNCPLPDFKS